MAEGREGTKTRRTPVVRDNSFTRWFADFGLVIDLGRATEIAFLQSTLMPTARVRKGSGGDREEGYETDPVVTEVGRVRMTHPQAFSMAMHIVQIMIEEERIEVEPFLQQLNKIIKDVGRGQDGGKDA